VVSKIIPISARSAAFLSVILGSMNGLSAVCKSSYKAAAGPPASAWAGCPPHRGRSLAAYVLLYLKRGVKAVKRHVFFACLATMLAVAQEKTTDPSLPQSSELVSTELRKGGLPVSYVPSDVKVLGALDYGQTSDAVDYTASPPYWSFVFSGYGGERVEAAVMGTDRKAFVAITDSSLVQIASGATRLSVRLPDRGPDIEAWYIVFRTLDNGPARFTVKVTKTENAPPKTRSSASPAH